MAGNIAELELHNCLLHMNLGELLVGLVFAVQSKHVCVHCALTL